MSGWTWFWIIGSILAIIIVIIVVIILVIYLHRAKVTPVTSTSGPSGAVGVTGSLGATGPTGGTSSPGPTGGTSSPGPTGGTSLAYQGNYCGKNVTVGPTGFVMTYDGVISTYIPGGVGPRSMSSTYPTTTTKGLPTSSTPKTLTNQAVLKLSAPGVTGCIGIQSPNKNYAFIMTTNGPAIVNYTPQNITSTPQNTLWSADINSSNGPFTLTLLNNGTLQITGSNGFVQIYGTPASVPSPPYLLTMNNNGTVTVNDSQGNLVLTLPP
jgi:collagen type VII alpha